LWLWVGFDRNDADDADDADNEADDADDAVTMLVRKSVRGCGFGFDRYDAMTPMTPMTQKRRWCARVGFRAEGSNLGR